MVTEHLFELHAQAGEVAALAAATQAWLDPLVHSGEVTSVEVLRDDERLWVRVSAAAAVVLPDAVQSRCASARHRTPERLLASPSPVELRATRASDAQIVVALSEAYRPSLVLRCSLLAGLFEAVPTEGADVATIAARCGCTDDVVDRLLGALETSGLVFRGGARWHLAALSRRYLRRDGAGWLGDLVLHNTRPALLARWSELPAQLGIEEDGEAMELRFVLAMTNVAAAGQEAAFVRGVEDLVDAPLRGQLLDIGGALGDYAIALCRRYDALQSTVLDRASTLAPGEEHVRRAGMAGRVVHVAGDYRRALPGGPYDEILLSNVIRGEPPQDARALLERARAALAPGGRLWVQDLVGYEHGPQAHRLFGLHLPTAMNPTLPGLLELLRDAGYGDCVVRELDGYVVSNVLLRCTPKRAPERMGDRR
jgi:hypothetical protein